MDKIKLNKDMINIIRSYLLPATSDIYFLLESIRHETHLIKINLEFNSLYDPNTGLLTSNLKNSHIRHIITSCDNYWIIRN